MIRKLLFAVLLLTSHQALAAPKIDQAGADALKPRIAESLNAVGATFGQNGITFKQTGNLLVEPAGEYYAITTPSITLDLPGGTTRTVGMVAINAIPTDNPDVFKVAVALPTPMLDSNAGKNVGALSIGSQAMSGLWNLSAFSFLQLDAKYKNIRDTNSIKGMDTSIPDMTITMKLDPKDKLYSGPFEMVVTGMDHREQKSSWSAGNMRVRAMLYDVDIALGKSISQTVSAGAPADIQAAAVAFATKLLDRADILIDEHDIAYRTETSAGTIKSITYKAGLTKIKSGAADGTLDMTGDGFASADPAAAQYSPSHMAAKMNFQKLPLAQMVAASNFTGIKSAFDKAGTHMVIENSTIDAPGYGVLATGDLTASTTSQLGVGKIHLEVRGIDQLTAYLSSPAGASALGLGSATNNLVPLLAVVQLAGTPGKDAQGRDMHGFDLNMTADGRVIMNGNDMTSVVSTLSAAANGAKAQGPLAPTILPGVKH